MKLLRKQTFLRQAFLLLLSLFALAVPVHADEEYDTVVAGTEFQPAEGDNPFFIKDKDGNTNDNLLFINLGQFDQDIEVCDNKRINQASGKLYFLGDKESHGGDSKVKDAYKEASDPENLSVHEYVISTPNKVQIVGGLTPLKNKPYSDKWMFITKTYAPSGGGQGPGSSILFYTLKNPKLDSNFKVEIGFVNLSSSTSGGMMVNLKYFIFGVSSNGNYSYIQHGDWGLNSGQTQNLTSKKSGSFSSAKYDKIIVAILNNGSEYNHIFGLDYIHIYSQYDIMEKTDTPTPIPYDGCVATPGEDIQLSTRVVLPEETNGELKFYKNSSLTQTATTFNTAEVGTKKFYYTYQEEGKQVSDPGTLTVTVKGNETLTVVSNPADATITCSVEQVTLSVNGTQGTTQYEWDGPITGLGNILITSNKGDYTVKGTGTNGCMAYGAITVKENKSAPTITALTSRNSKNEVSKDITCDEEVLTITPTVSSTNVTYSWSGPDNFNKTTKTISVDKPGTYTLVVKDKTTGCPSAPLSITIEDKTKKPVIEETYIKNVSGEDILDGALTCTNKKLVLSADITCDNPVSYSWTGPNNFSKTSAQVEVTAQGTYKLVVKDTKTGCQSDEREFYIQENKDKPVIEKIVATNSAGEETNIVTCTDGTLTITPTVSMRDVSYKWDNNKTTASITETAAGTYTLVVTNNTNGCPSEPKSITLTKDESVPTVTVKSFDSLEPNATEVNTLTCAYPELYIVADVDPTDVKYYWNGSGNSGDSYYKVTEPATYTLKVVSNVNGCVLDGIEYEIKQDTIKPVVKLHPQYKLDGSEGFTEFNCSRKEIELFADTRDSKIDVETYIWSNEGSTTSSQLMRTPGDYSVIVESANGCRDTSNITLTQNIVKPIISVESLGSDGEPRTVLTCLEQEVTLITTLHNESELGDGETQFYWLNLDLDGGAIGSTLQTHEPAEYQAYVVGANGCDARENITITMNQQRPVATLTQTAETITCSVPNVTISATTDIEADFLWYFDGKYSSDVTEITVDKGGNGILYVSSKTSGCPTLPLEFEVSQSTDVPTVPTIDDAKLALCPNTGIVNLASFIQSPSADVQYTFYNEQGEKVEVAAVNTNVPNMTYTYKVTATATNGCVSDNAEFEVVVDGLVDFDLVTSSNKVMVGGEETTVTVVPSGVVADNYVWELNGDKVPANGTEYTTRLYVDTKYEVTGISRCDKKTKDISVEVVWPTAFTPHNQNGKNDTFAKGMKLIVFNRFYTKIFEGEDGWDGTINGSMNDSKDIAVPGVYYYSVQLPNGDVKKGTIEIVKND